MLKYLHITNFAIIEHLELDFQKGLTVVTGETGAGKSIIIDALEIVCGSRTDSTIIRHNQEKCEIIVCLDIANINKAQEWLKLHEYGVENECIIRRILHKDGRSKLTLNGIPCSLQQMRDFSPILVEIHSQNQHQLLLKKNYQREILDKFGGHQSLCRQVQSTSEQWRQIYQTQQQLVLEKQRLFSQIELYRYQVDELDQLSVCENEYLQLDQEQKQLANAEKVIHSCHQTLSALHDSEPLNATKLLNQALNLLHDLQGHYPKLTHAYEFIQNASIQLDEAIGEIQDVLSTIEINPNRLQWVDNRIHKIHELARKHHVQPDELYSFHQELKNKLQRLIDSDQQSQHLEKQLIELEEQYQHQAQKLSEARLKTSQVLNKAINQKIQNLGLPGGQFKVALHQTDISSNFPPQGNEQVEFLISTNPGNPLQALSKVASGGELSRIALAIYVVIAQTHTSPILIFDEIDVGIGGSTAASVGNLLKTLAQTSQILCITHLPQVAAFGHHHLKVVKHLNSDQTSTTLMNLNDEEKVQELARMLGGVKVTDKTLAHAREMLEQESIT